MIQNDPENIPERALDWHRAGKGAVLATVIETWGSAPRPVGSQLVVSGRMAMMGPVFGGCCMRGVRRGSGNPAPPRA